MSVRPLPASALQRRCDPASLPFATTADLGAVDEDLGQERAADAIRFGLTMAHAGYNVFVLGHEGSGRHHLVERLLSDEAARHPGGDDWVYVHDFAHPDRPAALRLPAGDGPRLRDDMDRLVDDLRAAIEGAFHGDEYRKRRQALEAELRERTEAAMSKLGDEAASQGLALVSSPNNLAVVPVRDGEVIPPEEIAGWTDAERDAIAVRSRAIAERVEALVNQFPRWHQEQREKVRALDRETTARAVAPLVDRLRERWHALQPVLGYLAAVQADVLDNAPRLILSEPGKSSVLEALSGQSAADWPLRYQVNVLVERRPGDTAPVVYEDNPTLAALVGRIEHRAQLGTLVTDFMRVRPGALHRANGGFLVLDVAKLLREPLSWHHLKRALRSQEIRIETVGEAMGLVSTVTLQPEPIPLDVKVVLIGEPALYHALSELDPEFPALFKVMADVEPDAERTPEAEQHLARLVAMLARQQGLRPFTREAVARAIDHAARVRGDAARLTTHMQTLDDLLREADHEAARHDHAAVTEGDLVAAIDAARYRAGALRERSMEQLQRDLLHVETSGAVVGQVNGLMVLAAHPQPFGRPGRVTASVRQGTGQVVDIEREVKLGGPIHSKGVLILSGFLGGRYAATQPLAFHGSLVFEQSYGPIEGDSASLAETCALMSALADLPVRQDLAVTGSIDQHGSVQAVGGVNEKVEGFFDLCRSRGLTGAQGVLIPQSTAQFLMLDDDVVTAATEERFAVYAVANVDEAMALLTGVEPGERGADGTYPPDSINGRVEARLAAMAERAASFAKGPPPTT